MPKSPFLRSFRLICDPGQTAEVERLLQEEGFRFEPEPFSPFCRRLLHEPIPLGSSLAAFFGYIYIQDRSSMLPPLALAPKSGASVLDMCASPGSKTGFLAQLAGPDGFILGNEPNQARLGTLRANMHAANLLQVGTCSHPGESLPLIPASWSYILLDPPCSGWGTAEKNPKALKIWQGAKIDRLVGLQRALLRKAASLLAPGGLLLYSTCTTNHAENEEQTIFAEDELGLERVGLEPFAGFNFEERAGGSGCLLVEGASSQAQGFYLSLLRKPGQTPAEENPHDLKSPDFLQSAICDFSRLPRGETGIFSQKARFLPLAHKKLVPAGFSWQGALLGAVKNSGEFIPAPRLRCLLKDAPGHRLQIDDLRSLRALLNGRQLICQSAARELGLWWRDLPLGRVGVKNGRVLAAFH